MNAFKISLDRYLFTPFCEVLEHHLSDAVWDKIEAERDGAYLINPMRPQAKIDDIEWRLYCKNVETIRAAEIINRIYKNAAQ